MKTRLLIIIGIIVTVLVILLTYYGNSDTFEQEKWFDKIISFMHSHGLHNLTPPDTHPINSWYNNQMRDTDLQTVIDSCANDSPKERMRDGLRYTNETHVFMNLGCEWKKIGIFVGENEN